jgi:nicotinamidase-related amidase
MNQLDLSRAVLLPVDMQQAFDAPSWPRRWNRDVDANGLALLQAWRSAGRPIIHVRHDSVQPGSSLSRGAPGNAFRPGFDPVGDEPVVSKGVNSAFIGTDLDLRLKRLGASHVVVFGISTVPDACDCFDLPDGNGGTLTAEEVHRAHVATLAFEFCKVASTAELTGEV